jgi:hypothetical protein
VGFAPPGTLAAKPAPHGSRMVPVWPAASNLWTVPWPAMAIWFGLKVT